MVTVAVTEPPPIAGRVDGENAYSTIWYGNAAGATARPSNSVITSPVSGSRKSRSLREICVVFVTGAFSSCSRGVVSRAGSRESSTRLQTSTPATRARRRPVGYSKTSPSTLQRATAPPSVPILSSANARKSASVHPEVSDARFGGCVGDVAAALAALASASERSARTDSSEPDEGAQTAPKTRLTGERLARAGDASVGPGEVGGVSARERIGLVCAPSSVSPGFLPRRLPSA